MGRTLLHTALRHYDVISPKPFNAELRYCSQTNESYIANRKVLSSPIQHAITLNRKEKFRVRFRNHTMLTDPNCRLSSPNYLPSIHLYFQPYFVNVTICCLLEREISAIT